MLSREGVEIGLRRLLPDEISDVDGVEIAGRQESLDSLQPHMIGIDKVRPLPAQQLNRCIGLMANRGRLRADDVVFAIRLVPDRRHLYAALQRLHTRAQLGWSLTSKSIARANRIFRKRETRSRHDFSPDKNDC